MHTLGQQQRVEKYQAIDCLICVDLAGGRGDGLRLLTPAWAITADVC